MKINDDVIHRIIDSDSKVSIVYGENNSGKSLLLKSISEFVMNDNLKNSFMNKDIINCNLIPTNRLKIKNAFLNDYTFRDIETKIKTLFDKNINEYDSHLTIIRQMISKSDVLKKFMESSINEIFEIEEYNFGTKLDNILSDGVENTVNILSEILWTMLEHENYENLTLDELINLIASKNIMVLIDEIEMFLHVSIQVKFIDFLTKHFRNVKFVFTTHSPLLLSRVRFGTIYEIQDGLIQGITDDLYYLNLDDLYDSYFQIEIYPPELLEDIDYIHDVIDGDVDYDYAKIELISDNLRNNYTNIFYNMNQLLLIAKRKSKKNV